MDAPNYLQAKEKIVNILPLHMVDIDIKWPIYGTHNYMDGIVYGRGLCQVGGTVQVGHSAQNHMENSKKKGTAATSPAAGLNSV